MYAIKIMFMSGPDDGMESWLKSNQNKGRAIVEGWEFIAGRGEECDLKIPFDTQVSRRHAILRLTNEILEIEDLRSRNGTFVKKRRINQPAVIQPGELFRMGHTWLRMQEIQR